MQRDPGYYVDVCGGHAVTVTTVYEPGMRDLTGRDLYQSTESLKAVVSRVFGMEGYRYTYGRTGVQSFLDALDKEGLLADDGWKEIIKGLRGTVRSEFQYHACKHLGIPDPSMMDAQSEIKPQTPEKKMATKKTTMNMLKDNATQAAKTSAANEVNKKLVVTLRMLLEAKAGVALPAFFSTPTGEQVLCTIGSAGMHYIASEMMDPASAKAIRLTQIADLANQGAMNELMRDVAQPMIEFADQFIDPLLGLEVPQSVVAK